jgi:intein/homing endonuclease
MLLTTDEIFEEYAKCFDNPMYAIEGYFKTLDKTQNKVDKTKSLIIPFKLLPRQKDLIYAYEHFDKNIVTKPRQAGVTTTTAAYLAVKIGLADVDSPESVLIIANKQTLAFEFLAKIKEFISQLPRWMWGSKYYGSPEKEKLDIFTTNSKKEIRLPNGCRVSAVATSNDAIRGYSPTYLVMDEAAHIENGAEVYGTAVPALSAGGKIILISTPCGMDSLYYKTYDEAKKGKNNFNIVEMKWYEDLRYNKDLKWFKDENEEFEHEFTYASYEKRISEGWKPTSSWYEEMCAGMNGDERLIAQELDVSFIGSGGNVIGDIYIDFQLKNNVKEPIAKYGNEDEIWVWEYPIEGHEYVLVSDVSRGDGADYSTMVIIDVTTMEEVLEYQGKIFPDLLGYLIEEYGNMYNAYVIVDITGGMGVPTVLKLLELNYKRLHYENHNIKVLAPRQRKLLSHNKDNQTPGFQITSVRLPMIKHLEQQIRDNVIKIRSIRMISEMKTFIYRNGRPDHMVGFHDDCLKEDTLIKTIDGYKPIQEIKVGELVLTHKGRYKEVENIIAKPFNGDWYDMNFQGQLNLGLSYNHPLYAQPYNRKNLLTDNRVWLTPDKWELSSRGNKFSDNSHKPRQISIKETLEENKNHILNAIDFYIKSENETRNKIKNIVLDYEFAKFLGLFLADGHSVKNSKRVDKSNIYMFSIAFHIKDELMCIEMENYLDKLGINHHRSKVKGNGFALISSNKFMWYILSECYDENRVKKLPNYAKYLGKDLKYVLEYWLNGDGWVDTRKHYDIIGATTSKNLALSMRDIAWSLGKYCSIQEVKRHRYGKVTKDQYWLSIRNDFRDGDRLKNLGDFEYGTKTVKIKKSNYNGIVYNLQVSEDESFIANGIVVHNCLISLAIGLWVIEHSFKNLEKLGKQNKAMINAWIVGSNKPKNDNIKTEKEVKKPVLNPVVSRNIKDPNGNYMWLFNTNK